MLRRADVLLGAAMGAASLALTGLPGAAAFDQVPRLDVSRSCHAAETHGLADRAATYHNCMLDENDARTQLGQTWSKFKLSSRRACAPARPIPSYVEMLTCLEMYQDALLPYQGAGSAAAGGAAGGVSHDSAPPRPAMSPGPRPAGSF